MILVGFTIWWTPLSAKSPSLWCRGDVRTQLKWLKWVRTYRDAVPGPPFLQSGVPTPQRALFFPWERMFPAGKIVFIYGNARSSAEVSQPCQSHPDAFSCGIILLLSLTCWQECEGYYCCWNFPVNYSQSEFGYWMQGARRRVERDPQIFAGGSGIFTVPTALRLHFNPCPQLNEQHINKSVTFQ